MTEDKLKLFKRIVCKFIGHKFSDGPAVYEKGQWYHSSLDCLRCGGRSLDTMFVTTVDISRPFMRDNEKLTTDILNSIREREGKH